MQRKLIKIHAALIEIDAGDQVPLEPISDEVFLLDDAAWITRANIKELERARDDGLFRCYREDAFGSASVTWVSIPSFCQWKKVTSIDEFTPMTVQSRNPPFYNTSEISWLCGVPRSLVRTDAIGGKLRSVKEGDGHDNSPYWYHVVWLSKWWEQRRSDIAVRRYGWQSDFTIPELLQGAKFNRC